ncbi:MAG: hypothetical protein QW057_07550 [Candidatus Bathyarchaeia archaeon]
MGGPCSRMMRLARLIMRERASLRLMLHGAYPYYRCSGSIRASRALEPLVKRNHAALRGGSTADAYSRQVRRDKRLGRRLLADEATVYVRGVQA